MKKEYKKVTAIDVVTNNTESAIDALLEKMNTQTGTWEKSWVTSDNFKNINGRPYTGGTNLITLFFSQILVPNILGKGRSNFFVGFKQRSDMHLELEDECKTYSKDNVARRKEILKMYSELDSLKNNDADEEIILKKSKEIDTLNLIIQTHTIWQDIMFFNFSCFRLIQEGNVWYKQTLVSKNGRDYIVKKTEKTTKAFVEKNKDAINSVAQRCVAKYFKVAPVEYFKSTPEIEKIVGSEKRKIFDTHETLESWKVLNDYFKREKIRVNYKRQNQAFYDFVVDSITVPVLEQFGEEENAIAVIAHETVHSTGHKKRFNRIESGIAGSSSYAKEELVAEFGSMFFQIQEGILTEDNFKRTLLYTKEYLRRIKDGDEKNNLISAINASKKAVAYIYGSDKDINQN